MIGIGTIQRLIYWYYILVGMLLTLSAKGKIFSIKIRNYKKVFHIYDHINLFDYKLHYMIEFSVERGKSKTKNFSIVHTYFFIVNL